MISQSPFTHSLIHSLIIRYKVNGDYLFNSSILQLFNLYLYSRLMLPPEVDNTTGIPPPFMLPLILFFSASPLKLTNFELTRSPRRSRSSPRPVGTTAVIMPPLVLSLRYLSRV